MDETTRNLYRQWRGFGCPASSSLQLAQTKVSVSPSRLERLRAESVASAVAGYPRLRALLGGADAAKYGFSTPARTSWAVAWRAARCAVHSDY